MAFSKRMLDYYCFMCFEDFVSLKELMEHECKCKELKEVIKE